jgi:UDP-N-acetylmuramate--alanine ligase
MLGIGGAGVSALAVVLAARGERVSGCDLRESETTRRLAAIGIRVSIGHDPAHVRDQDRLVYTGAVRGANAELGAAREAGIETLTRAEMLADLIATSSAIAVTGTHGKTTVTRMIGHVLERAGFAPSVLVGDGASAAAGDGPWLVAEADESDGSLLLHHPEHAVLTNVELDHPDHFADVGEVRELFQAFLRGLPDTGTAVVCADDPAAATMEVPCHRVTYGFDAEADYRCTDERPFRLLQWGREVATIGLPQPGRLYVQDACAAAAMAVELGVPIPVVAQALESYPGSHRRLERLGTWRGAELYDDYGHHPTEVAATLQAARELGQRRLVVVFQPHRYSRLARMLDEFAESLGGADEVVVTEVYAAGEERVNGPSGAELAAGVPGARFAPDLDAARSELERLVRDGDLVLLMGAGDIWRLGGELAHTG